MQSTLSLFDYMMLAIGVYVLVAGIRGKGRLYSVDNIKEGMEEAFMRIMRKLYIALGIIMTFSGVISILKYVFYAYEEVIPATETMTAGFDWVLKPGMDLGAFRFLTIPVINIITYVCSGLSIAGIVIMIIATRKMTDKNAAARRTEQSRTEADRRQVGHTLPVSAFDFDEPASDAGTDGDAKKQA